MPQWLTVCDPQQEQISDVNCNQTVQHRMRDCDRLGHFFPHEAATVTDNITTNHDLLGREGPTYVDVDWKTS